ncbi:MAG: ribonuclease HII [Candidatus Aenigmarchaeota archaeon]|nr:ribonuclease HII [Candidatus Aenigmarchaeota archaeon]
MATLLGIDEAGRGAVIGPLVLGGVKIDKADESKLKSLGVKDSKLLSRKQREILYPKVKEIAKDYVVIKVPAKEIDELRKKINLNRIEAMKMGEMITAMKADEAIIDAPQVSTDKFKAIVKSYTNAKTNIICENYADMNHVTCAAASILAKVERDWEIDKIKEEVGFDLGVGYPSDERAINFVKKALKEKKFLEHIRFSWVTVSNIIEENEQKSLGEF